MKKKKRLFWILPAALLGVLAGVFFLYVSLYSRAEPSALEALVSDGTVSVTETAYGWFFDGPGEGDAWIFYPGGKVEETAYAPLLRRVAEGGLDVCLVRMPFRLAVFDPDGAEKVLAVQDLERWYIGGHSLGGAMAAVYAAGHGEPAGVILLAAYPTKPLEEGDLEILVYGSEDGVLDMEKLEKGRAYASGRVAELRIEGGNHARFGNYGKQSGDGEARITAEEQQKRTADFILKAVRGG